MVTEVWPGGVQVKGRIGFGVSAVQPVLARREIQPVCLPSGSTRFHSTRFHLVRPEHRVCKPDREGQDPPVTPDQFLERLAAVRIHRSHGSRAPHKPLMLLLALGRVGLGPESRLIPYETAEERFKELWKEFGRPGGRPLVDFPFSKLPNDDRLWEIPEESQLSTGRGEDILVSEAKRLGITGGFRKDVHDLLRRHPELVSRAASQILSEHSPPSIHQDILDAVRLAAGPATHGLDEPMPRRGRKVREYTPRDPRFRMRVLEAYDKRCAVCEYDIRFGDRLLGLEAAHIRWHSHDGRDVVPNGLALCGVHHKALDLGAMGLKSKGGGFRILISGRVRGRSPAARRLVGLHRRAIRPPVRAKDAPDRGFVEWHRGEVFQG